MSKPASTLPVSDAATASLAVPPQSIEAEQSVLGGLMLDNTAWDIVADLIDEDDFYRKDNRLIFQAIKRLANNNEPFDAVTLSDRLGNTNDLENAGGLTYLGTLVKNTPTAANIRTYATIVRERAVLRELIQAVNEIGGKVYRPEGSDTATLLDEAEQAIFRIAERSLHRRVGFAAIKDLLVKAVDRIDALFQQDSPITGVPTGFSDFDELTAGLQPGDLVIVAGRPSMGKTAFAINIAEHVVIKCGLPVAVFSLEMPGEQLAMRMLSSLGRINQHKLRTGKLGDEDWPRLTSAVGLLSEAPLYIDDSGGISPNELRARARRLQRDHKELGLIIVDYLQLMQVPGHRENRVSEISEISRSLKSLAKELNVPVMALSQLNRSLEQRPNKRPVMSDLRESGAIEQDADVITFIYRDEVYNDDSPDKGTAEIIVAKQRNGPIGMRRMTFLGEYTRFEDFVSTDKYAGESPI